MRRDRESGSGVVAYLGIMLFVSAVASALFALGVPDQVAGSCETAVCRIIGKDCPFQKTTLADGGSAPSGPAQPTVPPAPPLLDKSPPRPPIPMPVCMPEPDKDWVERLSAHNDYQNQNPLTGALNSGATSVEADIWLDDKGRLQLKHDSDDNPSAGTLREDYIKPLIDRYKKNGGQIYKGRDQPFEIFVEIKHGGHEAYQQMLKDLKGLPPGVKIIIPYSAAGADLGKQPPGVSFSSGFGKNCTLPPELDPENPLYDRAYAQNVTVLNGQYGECADRNGDLLLNDSEHQKLNEMVQKAHSAGLKVRLWGGPDGKFRVPGDPGGFFPCPKLPGHQSCEGGLQNNWWNAQLEAGVDYVISNHLDHTATKLRDCGRKT
jgi:glycerophosphoryl diester phosphodiesterase